MVVSLRVPEVPHPIGGEPKVSPPQPAMLPTRSCNLNTPSPSLGGTVVAAQNPAGGKWRLSHLQINFWVTRVDRKKKLPAAIWPGRRRVWGDCIDPFGRDG